ncbi:hypothetical protein QYM36_013710 [Artemia franciscana]|uniref:J domain-containing protein n=1 Tax=Artemia franciscana TaxID=6661 RepID=A0AA88L2D8_ARTSF|nr:hypothetical protein QYM36_013710 [Artemia franciscana]
MAQKFHYDESGSTFYFFYTGKKIKECNCDGCQIKDGFLKKKKPSNIFRQYVIQSMLIFGWLLMIFAAYRTQQFDYEYANFDPYNILGIDIGASNAEIKTAYKTKALVYHPDKETGDETLFMNLTKAYKALTDETAKRNWELYGDPDGSSAVSFGIALPSWIVKKDNSMLVLLVYVLIIMIVLPITVWNWWSRSIKYSGEVLLETTQMYYYYFHKTPSMILKRVIMILGASFEFHVKENSEIQERPSDNEEIHMLFKILPQLNEKNQERPFCFSYSVKSRALIYAHLSRLSLNPQTLEKDRIAVIRKCPTLIQEMCVCFSQLMMLAHAGQISRMPHLFSLENTMKLCPMIVQALWDHKNPLLQLPHIDEDILKYINSKYHVKTLEQFVRLDENDKRKCLRSLTEKQYCNVCKVLGNMPLVNIQIKVEVIDDEETNVITAGALVTASVILSRKSFSSLMNMEGNSIITSVPQNEPKIMKEEVKEVKEEDKKKTSIWKPKRKSIKRGAEKKTSKKFSRRNIYIKLPVEQTSEENKEDKKESVTIPEIKVRAKEQTKQNQSNKVGSQIEDDIGNLDARISQDEDSENKEGAKDDEDWDKFQNTFNKRQKVLERKSRSSHSVHCPYFSEDKQEFWWVYLTDKKTQRILTAPFHVTSLIDKKEIMMAFTAPVTPGLYKFTLCVRSDSYLGLDQFKDFTLDVKRAPEPPKNHPQFDFSSDEDEKREAAEFEYATDTDDSAGH